MKTLTIRGIEPELVTRIKETAKKQGESINKQLLKLLRSTYGLARKPTFPTYHDLDHLAGTWTAEDEKEFFANIRELETIDKELWE